MAAAEFSVKVSGAAERGPLRWPPPLAASCRVLQNGGRRRSRAGLLSSASGPPRNPWPLLPFPDRPGRRGLQSGLSGGRGAVWREDGVRAWRASCLGGRDAARGGARPLARDQRGGRVRSPASRWGGGVWALWPAAAALGEGEAPCCHRGTPSGGSERAGGRLPAGEQRAARRGRLPPGPGPRPSEARPHWSWGRNPLLFCSRGVGRRFPLPCCGPALPAASHTRPVGRGERTGGGQSRPGGGE